MAGRGPGGVFVRGRWHIRWGERGGSRPSTTHHRVHQSMYHGPCMRFLYIICDCVCVCVCFCACVLPPSRFHSSLGGWAFLPPSLPGLDPKPTGTPTPTPTPRHPRSDPWPCHGLPPTGGLRQGAPAGAQFCPAPRPPPSVRPSSPANWPPGPPGTPCPRGLPRPAPGPPEGEAPQSPQTKANVAPAAPPAKGHALARVRLGAAPPRLLIDPPAPPGHDPRPPTSAGPGLGPGGRPTPRLPGSHQSLPTGKSRPQCGGGGSGPGAGNHAASPAAVPGCQLVWRPGKAASTTAFPRDP